MEGNKTKEYLVQSIEMGNDRLLREIAEHKLSLVMDLDPSSKHGKYVDCMFEYYKGKNRIFAVHNNLQ